jgi:hypothetical protein
MGSHLPTHFFCTQLDSNKGLLGIKSGLVLLLVRRRSSGWQEREREREREREERERERERERDLAPNFAIDT